VVILGQSEIEFDCTQASPLDIEIFLTLFGTGTKQPFQIEVNLELPTHKIGS
jgi:hypothetical protein